MSIKKPEELEKRRETLESYMNKVVKKVELYADSTFVDFVELTAHKPNSLLNHLEPKQQMSHVLMGYRDMYFSNTLKYYFAVILIP